MKKLIKGLRNALYILLPLCFFALWYVGVGFVINEYNPSYMTEENRFVIAWFGVSAALLGLLVAMQIDKQKY